MHLQKLFCFLALMLIRLLPGFSRRGWQLFSLSISFFLGLEHYIPGTMGKTSGALAEKDLQGGPFATAVCLATHHSTPPHQTQLFPIALKAHCSCLTLSPSLTLSSSLLFPPLLLLLLLLHLPSGFLCGNYI